MTATAAPDEHNRLVEDLKRICRREITDVAEERRILRAAKELEFSTRREAENLGVLVMNARNAFAFDERKEA